MCALWLVQRARAQSTGCPFHRLTGGFKVGIVLIMARHPRYECAGALEITRCPAATAASGGSPARVATGVFSIDHPASASNLVNRMKSGRTNLRILGQDEILMRPDARLVGNMADAIHRLVSVMTTTSGQVPLLPPSRTVSASECHKSPRFPSSSGDRRQVNFTFGKTRCKVWFRKMPVPPAETFRKANPARGSALTPGARALWRRLRRLLSSPSRKAFCESCAAPPNDLAHRAAS